MRAVFDLVNTFLAHQVLTPLTLLRVSNDFIAASTYEKVVYWYCKSLFSIALSLLVVRSGVF
jgi:hypothetical protein